MELILQFGLKFAEFAKVNHTYGICISAFHTTKLNQLILILQLTTMVLRTSCMHNCFIHRDFLLLAEEKNQICEKKIRKQILK